MTKRFLIILVLVFWCNVGFAEIIRLEKCHRVARDSFDNKRYENKYWDIDLEKKR
jgi:hypothetical protein